MACMYGRSGGKILVYQRDILVWVVVAPAVVLNADARHIAHRAQGLHAHCTNKTTLGKYIMEIKQSYVPVNYALPVPK